MKPVKLSPFAASNIQRLTPAQQKAVRLVIEHLSASGLHQSALEVHRLPSGRGYVVSAGKDGRLTVMHSGGGNLLVDDVFVTPETVASQYRTAPAQVAHHIKPASKQPLKSVHHVRDTSRQVQTVRGVTLAAAKKATAKKATKKA